MKKALLIIDVQNDYFDGGAMPLVGSREAAENIKLLIDKFRSETMPIIFIQHISNRAGATFFLPESNGAEVYELIKPLSSEKVIVKNYPNSFRETDLLEYLNSQNISDLVVCGMMTHICVDSTVRAAKDLGFNITLISDACATKDLEFNGQIIRAAEVQASFLAALSYFFSTVHTAGEYLGE